MDKNEKTSLPIQIKQKQGNEKATNKENEFEVLIMNYQDDDFYEDEVDGEVAANIKVNADTCKGNTKLEFEFEQSSEAKVKEVDEKNGHISKEIHYSGITPYQRQRYSRKLDDPNRKLLCANCDFKAIKKHHLVNHIKQAHPRNQQPKQIIFECEHCMFSSRYKTSLNMHISTFHIADIGPDSKDVKKQSSYDVQGIKVEDHSNLGKNVYSCNYCSFTTQKRIGMRHHVVLHVVEKKPVKQCPHCPLRFVKPALNRHVQQVHNPEGVFKCPKCYYMTKYRNNLRRHIKQNQDLKPCLPIRERKTSVFSKNAGKEEERKGNEAL